MKSLITILISLVLLSSCRKDIKLKNEQSLAVLVKNLSVIYNNDLFFINNLAGNYQQLTFNPDKVKTDLKMSYDYQKFAYKNDTGFVEIVDKNGNLITILSDYPNVKSFDWSSDSETLWLLVGNNILFYGPEMDLPNLDYPPGLPDTYSMKILQMSISRNGDIAYFYTWDGYGNDPSNGQWWQLYGNGFVRIFNDNNQTMIYESSDGTFHERQYLNFSPNNQDLILGLGSESSISSINIFKGQNPSPSKTINGNHSMSIYRSDLDILISSKMTKDAVPVHKIFIEDLETNNVETNEKFISYANQLYIDWK